MHSFAATSPQKLVCFRPDSARVLALLERGLRRKLTIRIVNANLHFVIIFLAFLAAGIGVRSSLFRDGCLVACRFLRGTIETILHRVTGVFEFFDDRFILLVEARCYLDVLLRGLRGASDRCQFRGQCLGVDLRLFDLQSQFFRVNERDS